MPITTMERTLLDCVSWGTPTYLMRQAVDAALRDGLICEGDLAGFYTLSSQSMARSGVGGWLARNAPSQIPVILLGMLGVDARWHGEGLGHSLLVDAAQRSSAVAQSIGARALVVDPADDSARAFYVRHGFRPIPGSNRLFAKLSS